MATTPLNFFTGPESNINSLAKKQGQVIFAVSGDETTGNIYQDISNTKRIKIGKNAETAQKDANGNVITDTYETKIDTQNKLDAILENLKNKSNIDHTHAAYDEAISDLEDEVAIDYSQIAFDTGSEYVDSGIDFSVYQTKADGTLSTAAKTVSGAINELDADIDNEASLRTNADTALDNKIAQLSNPNLLINSDFRNPVNQRGQTRYTRGSSDTYTIDRWVLNYATVLDVLDGCVQLTGGSANNCYWLQYFETHLSGTFTVSFNVLEVTGDMKFHILDGATPHNVLTIVPGINTATFTVSDLVRIGFCALKTGAVAKIEWIKLEQGSIATPFVPRPYGEELALCQRYYRKIQRGTKTIFTPICVTSVRTARTALDFSMRMTPTINVSSCYTRTSSWKSITNYISCEIDNNSNVIVVMLEFDTDVYPGNCYADSLIIDGYMSFDAEIY